MPNYIIRNLNYKIVLDKLSINAEFVFLYYIKDKLKYLLNSFATNIKIMYNNTERGRNGSNTTNIYKSIK